MTLADRHKKYFTCTGIYCSKKSSNFAAVNFHHKFIFKLKKIAPDKWKHFFVGIPLGTALQIVSLYLFPMYPLISITASFVILAAGCYAFELFSLITGKGHHELWDVLAGVLGGLIGIGAVFLLAK